MREAQTEKKKERERERETNTQKKQTDMQHSKREIERNRLAD